VALPDLPTSVTMDLQRREAEMDDSTTTPLPTVSIVVPTYRRPDALGRTISALVDQDYPADRYEVIVVDDGSGDSTPDVVAALQETSGAKLIYLRQDNAGAATARNHGARAASGELLIFVDDDIVVERSHIRDHLRARGDGDPLVNGHWEFPDELTEALEATPFGRFRLGVERWVKDGIVKVAVEEFLESPSAVTACNLSVRKDAFWQLGGFDEDFPFAGYEDQELSFRAVNAGRSLLYDRRIHLLHNDQRLTLGQFCERQRRGACTAVYLARRHPAEFAARPIITENGPLVRQDPIPVMAKKTLKRLMTWRPALRAIHAGVHGLEKLAPDSRLLQRAYWSLAGLHIFLGVRDGFAAFSSTRAGDARVEARCP
jgi:glycosyltransferase involved in cell wall biosynthesis